MCEYLEEIEELKAKVAQEADRANSWSRLWLLKVDTVNELRATLSNTKAELSVVRSNLADTTTALDKYRNLDKYRDMHVKMSRANSGIWKSDSDLEDTIRTLTEERDIAREMFQGMVSKYAELSDRHSKMCDDYDGLVSRYDDLLLRCDDEHGEV